MLSNRGRPPGAGDRAEGGASGRPPHGAIRSGELSQTLQMTGNSELGGVKRPAGVAALTPENHVCEVCGITYSTTSPERAMLSVVALPPQLRAGLSRIPDDVLRIRPEPGTWSVIEYVCHIRDVLATTTIRIHRTLTEDDPVVDPMLNDLRADRFGYNRRALPPLLDEVADVADGLLRETARIVESDWDRSHRRYPGEDRSARWLIRQAMHEGTHHLLDIDHVSRRLGAGP